MMGRGAKARDRTGQERGKKGGEIHEGRGIFTSLFFSSCLGMSAALSSSSVAS